MKNLNNVPKVWNIQYDGIEFFGRKEFLDDLKKAFEATSQNTKQVAIVGLPGTGKTQTAKQYARVYKKHYDIVWWFYPAENMDNQFLNLAKEINAKFLNLKQPLLVSSGDPKETIEQIKDFLRTTNHHWLLIFDDMPDASEVQKFIPEHHSSFRGHILITSKNPKDWHYSMHLDKFPRATSIELIQSITEDKDKDSASQLATILDDYPILIAYAAQAIKNLFSSTKHFLKTMQTSDKRNSVADLAHETLRYTLDNIEKSSKAAYELLLFSAILFNENIPRELLERWYFEHQKENVYDFEIALGLLSRNFLFSKSSALVDTLTIDYELYNMHDIIRKVILKRVDSKTLKGKIQEAIVALNSVLDKKGKKVALPEFAYIYPQIFNIAKLAQSNQITNELLLYMQVEVLDYYQIVERNYTKMEEHAKLLTYSFESINSCKDELCARFNTAMSALKWWKGNHRAGIPYQLKSLKYYETYKPGVNEHIRALTYLSSHYSFLGDIENAKRITQEAMQYLQKLTDNDNMYYYFNSALIHQNLTYILSHQGKHQEAIIELEKAIHDIIYGMEKQFTNSDKRLSIYLHFLIHQQELLLLAGEGKNQLEKLQSLYKDAIRVLNSKRHRLCGILLSLIGNSLNLQGKTKEAEAALMESIFIFDDWFGKGTHRLQGQAYTILGDIYMNAEEPIKALNHYLEAENIYKNAYTSLKVDEVSALYGKIALAGLKIKDELTMRHYFNLHQSIFGKQHPRTIEISWYLTKEIE